MGDRLVVRTLQRETLEITAFARARDHGEHFTAYYGPTIAARANATKDGREREFDEALDAFWDRWDIARPARPGSRRSTCSRSVPGAGRPEVTDVGPPGPALTAAPRRAPHGTGPARMSL
jgi:hypothetical protein